MNADQPGIQDLVSQIQQELSREKRRVYFRQEHMHLANEWIECYHMFVYFFGYMFRSRPTFEEFYMVAWEYDHLDLARSFSSRSRIPALMYLNIKRAILSGDWPELALVEHEVEKWIS